MVRRGALDGGRTRGSWRRAQPVRNLSVYATRSRSPRARDPTGAKIVRRSHRDAPSHHERTCPNTIDQRPNLCGAEPHIDAALRASRRRPVFLPESRVDLGGVKSAFADRAAHAPAADSGGRRQSRTAEIISNLKHMMDNPGIGDNHNASVFHWCYKRIGEFIPQLVDEGKQPRVMLEYSGTLLHGLRQMGLNDVFDSLKPTSFPSLERRG